MALFLVNVYLMGQSNENLNAFLPLWIGLGLTNGFNIFKKIMHFRKTVFFRKFFF